MFEWLTPGIGSALSGLLSAGSGILGGMMGASGQAASNAAQMAQIQQSEQWMEHMSNTSYQRGMADMRAAGLNPILAANLGGASTPGAPSTPMLGNPGAFMQQGITSAGQAMATAAQTKAVMTQAEKDKSQIGVNDSTATLNNATTAATAATTEKLKADTAVSAKQLDKLQSDIEANNASARNSDSSAALNAARTIVAGHDANTARANAEYRQLEVDQFKNIGKGPGSDLLGGVSKTVNTIGNAVDRDVVQPVRNMFSKAIDWTRSNLGSEVPNSARSQAPTAK